MWPNWEKFLLLTWKNWLLQWRHPIQTIVEIIAPVLFSILLVLIRSLVDPEPQRQIIYPEFPLDRSAMIFNFNNTLDRILWSPCNNNAIDQIMRSVATHFQLEANSNCAASASELQSTMLANALFVYAGFQFDDSYAGRDTIDQDVHITFRFPGELRTTGTVGLGDNNWRTHLLFPLYQIAGPRSPSSFLGAIPQYFHETFLTFQYEVSRAVINHFVDDVNVELPKVFMSRFPYPNWIDDPLLTALQSFVGIIIMLSFVYTCINTVKVITTEKEKQLKEAMKIMGLPNWLHWTAWFLKSFFFLLISIILIVVLLKVSWYPDTDVSVFTHTDPFLMFVFLVFYVCSIITFCFAVSVFFSKANTAAAIAGLFWFLSYCPYFFLQERYAELSLAQKLLASLAGNTAMAYGFQLMLMFEGTGEGLQWSNIFSSVSPDDDLTLGLIMMMLIIDAIIYLLIALYVEAVFPGDYGVPQVWYFPFTKNFWCSGKSQYVGVDDNDNVIPPSDIYEKEPTGLRAGIQIKNLRKVYSNKKVAVRDMSLNMFEGQITVLLGHNGAGKTTTMSMLTGMFPPSSGTAVVNGYDIRTDMKGIRNSLGLCPQHNIIFDELTVREHLYFFSKLKGLEKKAIEAEITKYIDLLELTPKTNEQAKTLSGGMKRKLCVGMALCGNSKVVMFDEPTAGMDPAARRALWDLMEKQKEGRTILLSTHFMDEADLLGDRIAIMAGGLLQCCGSSFFLKKRYGAGYHLIMEKSLKCDVSKVTDVLRRHISNIEVESNVGSELTYVLAESEASVFETMLSDLENNSASLGVNSYGISLTTLEEVFMKVGADHGQEEENDHLDLPQKKGNGVALLSEQNGNYNNSSETKLNTPQSGYLTGVNLWINQFLAMMMKRILSTLRSWILFIVQNLIPVAFLIMAILVTRGNNVNQDLPNLDYTLDSYDSMTVMTTDNTSNSYFTAYRDLLQRENRAITDWAMEDMITNMLDRTAENAPRVRMQYIIGGTFNSGNDTHNPNITAWFNNEPFHSPPLALEYAMNSILQEKKGPEHSIQISLHPLPFSIDTRFTQLANGNTMGFQLAFNIGFSMAFVAAFYVLFYVRERVSKSKHLQFVSGAEILIFWGASFLWDVITFIFTSVCLIITLAAFQEEGFSSAADLGRIFAVLLCFCFAFLPLMYLASYLFEVPSTGFTRMTLVNIFTGVAAFMVVQVLSFESLDLVHVADALHWVFLFLPPYSMCMAINDMSVITSIQNLCALVEEMSQSYLESHPELIPLLNTTNMDFACFIRPNECCDIQEDYFAWERNGIGKNVFFSILVGCILIALLLLNEYQIFSAIQYKLEQKFVKIVPIDANEDSDVAEERQKILAGQIRTDQTNIVLRNLTKYYKRFLAVNQICLGINEYECFGLLGVNGAGKTSTFKMMTGDVSISHGDAWINGLNVKKDMKKVNKHIGYCPQFDALLDDLTGEETLIMYCLLRGIPFKNCRRIAEQLSRDFDFHRHLKKKVKEYSGGNKRKLSAALALIGDPAIIFLDEPTTGMDPATKRNLWNTLCHIRDSGKCLVLTSHSMEECEALCTRLAIMVNGVFKCLGSTQHLKNKFSQGYLLTIKLRKSELQSSEIQTIEWFVKANFPSAIVREKHQELLTFYIPDKSMPWSKMFGIMEKGKKENQNIEDYSLGQSSLEQVFLSFTKNQRD